MINPLLSPALPWWESMPNAEALTPSEAAAVAVKARELNADRFIDARFCRAEVERRIDRTAAK